jgi:hypothetical protein
MMDALTINDSIEQSANYDAMSEISGFNSSQRLKAASMHRKNANTALLLGQDTMLQQAKANSYKNGWK